MRRVTSLLSGTVVLCPARSSQTELLYTDWTEAGSRENKTNICATDNQPNRRFLVPAWIEFLFLGRKSGVHPVCNIVWTEVVFTSLELLPVSPSKAGLT